MRAAFIGTLIVLLAAAAIVGLEKFKPKPEEQAVVALITPVEISVAKRTRFPVQVVSHGVLEAKTHSAIVSEVSAKVIEVSPSFETGGRFVTGDILVRLDPADYEAALAQAKSVEADAGLALEMEEAKAIQSLRDWDKLGRADGPSALVKREPQLASARARLAAAEAGVEKASRDLERTVLRAPYDGRIVRTYTEVASYAAMGTPLVDLYESSALEVRLPVSLSDLPYLELGASAIAVEVRASTGETWKATVVREDSEIDRRSRSLHLIAALDPAEIDKSAVLVPGLFVQATISGKVLEQVVRMERRALVDENQVIVVNSDNTLTKRPINVVRKEAEHVLVSEGLEDGDQVCVSYVPGFVEGMKVRLITQSRD